MVRYLLSAFIAIFLALLFAEAWEGNPLAELDRTTAGGDTVASSPESDLDPLERAGRLIQRQTAPSEEATRASGDSLPGQQGDAVVNPEDQPTLVPNQVPAETTPAPAPVEAPAAIPALW